MSDGEALEGKRLVQVRFQPLWRYVDGIREFCGFFTRTTFDDPAVGERIGIVVHELVENAIRYSSREADALLELTVYSRCSEIEVVVANSADPDQLVRFQECFATANVGDPRAAYTEAMKRVRTLPDDESGLGLPRIRYEGGMNLELTVTAPNVVKISAKGEL